MAGRVVDDKVAEVRERANIAEVISRYVSLRRSGRNHMGLCPFHGEKTPSFSVSEERGFFHCFGCGVSGDVFGFLMRIESLTFPEALERLAREHGIELPRRPQDVRREEGRERLFGVNAVALEFFQRALWKSPAGELARAYLRKREIRDETARSFSLGYAPPEGLAAALLTAKVAMADAEALGLVAKSRAGGWYDRFRQRLVFPITDLSGRTIAFGGRLIGDSTDGPKYLNSPESPLFQKRRSLFGVCAAREAIRKADRVVVVEGYIDAISLWQAGVENVVAPLGTALSAEQIRLLRRFGGTIVVFFDGDEAGLAAAARSFAAFAEVGVFADAAFLPDGEDPDTFVRSAGRAGIERLLADASPLVDHYLRSLAARGAPLPARMRAAQAVRELLGRLDDEIFKDLFARRAAEHLEIDVALLQRKARVAPRPPAPAPPRAPAALSPPELLLIEILLVHPELRGALPEPVESLIASDAARALVVRLREPGARVDDFLGELAVESRERVARALLGEAEIYAEPERILADLSARVEQQRREERLRAIARDIRDAERRGDDVVVQRLLAEKQRLAAESKAVGRES